jgi:protein-L-isoaspartate(D-aspartate) O-methyltransferase
MSANALEGLRQANPVTSRGARIVGSVAAGLAAVVIAFSAAVATNGDGYATIRDRMVQEQIQKRGVTDLQTLAAMRAVPRHEFVDESQRRRAYQDTPLPIGHGQTISQPYIVALMTELANLKPGDRTLEIGTGSGYQAAVLAEITPHVHTIEIIEPLAASADARLKRLGYDTVEVKFGDGYHGWAEHAPFDAIIVTAAADHVPPPLLEQLKPGGRMVIPLGGAFHKQTLVLVRKDEQGAIRTRNIAPVAFVPFTRELKR